MCRLQFFLFFFVFVSHCNSPPSTAAEFCTAPCRHSHRITPHRTLSRPRTHQTSNCRRARTHTYTGVLLWKRAQAHIHTHTQNKTAGGSSPQQNILSARRWLNVLVCVYVFRSIYKCIYTSVCVCMFAVHVVIEFERCCCCRRRRLLLSRNFLFL